MLWRGTSPLFNSVPSSGLIDMQKPSSHTCRRVKVKATYRRSDLFEEGPLLMEQWADYCGSQMGEPMRDDPVRGSRVAATDIQG